VKFAALRNMTKFTSETIGLGTVQGYRLVFGAVGTNETRDLDESQGLELLERSSFPSQLSESLEIKLNVPGIACVSMSLLAAFHLSIKRDILIGVPHSRTNLAVQYMRTQVFLLLRTSNSCRLLFEPLFKEGRPCLPLRLLCLRTFRN